MNYLGDRFHDALKDGGRALIAGVAEEQLPVEYRSHPRIVCWDSDAPQLRERRIQLPPRVRAVVMARFLSHATATQLSKASKRGAAVYFGKVQGTGEIARMLRTAMPVETPLAALPPLPTTPESPMTIPQDRGSIPAFRTMADAIRFFAHEEIRRPVPDGQVKASPRPKIFYEGLTKLVQTHGFPKAEVLKVSALFSYLRGKSAPPMVDAGSVELQLPVMTAPVVAEPVVVAPVVPVTDLPPDLEALIQTATDLDLRALMISDMADQLRRLVVEQRSLRDVKAKYDALLGIMQKDLK